ncbi:MAG: chemotaxis protein CheW [Candidatus Altiarchaeales archaeon ex4484_96]|nr:MAG: chemotaxis protein CheW [Candidatus Altiarchaeales archaeon ex4484_96]
MAPANYGGMEEKSGDELQIVVFKLGDEEYACEIHKVREIIKMPSITPVPRTPAVIKGIINVRGKIVVVVDLKERFDLGKDEDGTHIILVETDGRMIGVIVDDISHVLRITSDHVKEPPDIITRKIHADYIHGIVILEEQERFIILLDVDELFSEEEWEGLAAAEYHGNRTELADVKEITETELEPEKEEEEKNKEKKSKSGETRKKKKKRKSKSKKKKK